METVKMNEYLKYFFNEVSKMIVAEQTIKLNGKAFWVLDSKRRYWMRLDNKEMHVTSSMNGITKWS